MWRNWSPVHCWWECGMAGPMWENSRVVPQNIKIELPWDPAVQFQVFCLQCGRPGFDPWVGRSPGEGNGWLPTTVFWSGEFHGLYSSWGRKESDTTEHLSLSLHFFPSNSASGYIPQKTESRILKRYLHTHGNSSAIYKLKRWSNWYMNKQNIHPMTEKDYPLLPS